MKISVFTDWSYVVGRDCSKRADCEWVFSISKTDIENITLGASVSIVNNDLSISLWSAYDEKVSELEKDMIVWQISKYTNEELSYQKQINIIIDAIISSDNTDIQALKDELSSLDVMKTEFSS